MEAGVIVNHVFKNLTDRLDDVGDGRVRVRSVGDTGGVVVEVGEVVDARNGGIDVEVVHVGVAYVCGIGLIVDVSGVVDIVIDVGGVDADVVDVG